MQIEIFALCDAATTDSGKLNVLGAFDSLWVSKIPAVHSQCAIALRVRFEKIERGEHKLTVQFVDIDGKNVMPPARGDLLIKFPDEQKSLSSNFVLNIQGLKLERLGEYAIDLAVDGQQKASLPLFVRERK